MTRKQKQNWRRRQCIKVRKFLERSGVMAAEQVEDGATIRNLHRDVISKASQRAHKGECRHMRQDAFEGGCRLPFAPFKIGKTWLLK